MTSSSETSALTAGRARAGALVGRGIDRLVGTRLKASLRRRVREEVGGQRDAWSADVETLVAAEVSRQLAEHQPSEPAPPPAREPSHTEFTLDVLLGAGTRFSRSLTRERWRTLADDLRTLTGTPQPEFRMTQAYRTLLDHEIRGLGRIAGSSYNIVGKLVAPVLLAPPAGAVLEIGTLFGLFSPALVKQFRQLGQFRSLTVIDPLAGHQIQPGRSSNADPTGTPVDEQIARHNFAIGGLAEDSLRLITGFSTDPEVQAQAGDQPYAVVIIDGDHSEDGVYADLQWAETILAPGGIAVMDDFGDPTWPGVERATRRFLADGGRLELLGRAATSAYLRQPTA